MIKIDRIDHLVLTVKDISKSCLFYEKALGMKIVHFGQGRTALHFGNQKINLHKLGSEFQPNARNANAGTADICLIAETSIELLIQHWGDLGITPETEIVNRTGADGVIRSVYIRDPDGNLLEISNYKES